MVRKSENEQVVLWDADDKLPGVIKEVSLN